MYIVRDIMHCKPGKVRELVNRFKALSALGSKSGVKPFRIMTDVSGGPFWTVVAEIEVESLDGFFKEMETMAAQDEAKRIMAGYHDLVESGGREFYKVEG
jgi:hypothetical protein